LLICPAIIPMQVAQKGVERNEGAKMRGELIEDSARGIRTSIRRKPPKSPVPNRPRRKSGKAENGSSCGRRSRRKGCLESTIPGGRTEGWPRTKEGNRTPRCNQAVIRQLRLWQGELFGKKRESMTWGWGKRDGATLARVSREVYYRAIWAGLSQREAISVLKSRAETNRV